MDHGSKRDPIAISSRYLCRHRLGVLLTKLKIGNHVICMRQQTLKPQNFRASETIGIVKIALLVFVCARHGERVKRASIANVLPDCNGDTSITQFIDWSRFSVYHFSIFLIQIKFIFDHVADGFTSGLRAVSKIFLGCPLGRLGGSAAIAELTGKKLLIQTAAVTGCGMINQAKTFEI